MTREERARVTLENRTWFDQLIVLRSRAREGHPDDSTIAYSFRRDEYGNLRLDDFDTSVLPFADESVTWAQVGERSWLSPIHKEDR